MLDISQIAGSDIIMFSAESSAADLWMRQLYGRNKIYFHVPADHERLKAFVRAAKAHGFSISSPEDEAKSAGAN
jgi:hypothetical protein